MLAIGEIRSGLLRNSRAMPQSSLATLLQLLPGERVAISERPVAYAVSPQRLTGVDCQLPTASRTRCRGVGTLSARAVVTGGRIVQGSAFATVERGGTNHRRPWSHYLALPGVVQTIGKLAPADDVADGHLAGHTGSDLLDLGAVSERLLGTVQGSALLDHRVPLLAKRTRLRWAVRTGGDAAPGHGPGQGNLVIVDETVRTLDLTLPDQPLPDVLAFCENLALHDWLLSTLLYLVERSAESPPDRTDSADRAERERALDKLGPAIDHLLHLWMPGAHVSPSMLTLWDRLEARAGFTRQWNTTVGHIRDRLSLTMVAALNKP